MQSNPTVVRFRSQQDTPVNADLSKSLHGLPWRLRAQSILDLMGYNSTNALTGESCCAKTSHAHQMGAGSLTAFCELIKIDETEVISELNALHLSSKLGIPGDSPEDILSEHKKVVSILGREPVSSSEVMNAISHAQDLKITSLRSLNRDLETKIDEGKLKVLSLERLVDEKNRELIDAKERYGHQINKLEENNIKLKKDFSNQLKDLEKQHAIDIKNCEAALTEKLEEEFSERLGRLTQDHQDNIAVLAKEKEIAIRGLKDIIDNEMVSLQDFDSVNLENEQLREINRDNLVKIKDYADKLNNLEGGNYEEIEGQMEELRQKLFKLKQAYLVMEEACMKYKRYSARMKKRLERVQEETKRDMAKITEQKAQPYPKGRKSQGLRKGLDVHQILIAVGGMVAVAGSYLLMA